MASAIPLFLCFLTIYLHCVAAQQTNGSVSVGASLTAAPDARPWLSPSGEFAFGFQQPQGNDSFLLSIWYDKIPEKTIIWYPEDGRMVPRGSKAELIGRGLVLSDPQGGEIWSSGTIFDLAYGLMNDTGNFQLVGSDSSTIWESFDHPADTLLPAQILARGREINSKMSQTNFSGGRFQLRLLPDGNLVLNTVDLFSGSASDAYYVSGTNDDSNSTNSGEQVIFNATGYLYILRRNGKRFDLTPRDAVPSGNYYHRATLDSDGVFTQYYYAKNSTTDTSWKVIWLEPQNICETGKGCGLNNVCSLDGNRPKCECPQGFSLNDPSYPNGDCDADFVPSCDASYREEQFDFTELNNIDWPGSDYASMNPSNEENCKLSCLKECICVVAIYRDNQCWKKKIPLSNGRKDPSKVVTAFLKFSKAAQQTKGSVSVGASLMAAPDARPWLSPSGDFALGFHQPQGKDSFLLSIWYDKIPDRTIIWYPKNGTMVPRGSKVELIDRRGLVLSDPQGGEVWSSGSNFDLAYGLMNDTGNFQIVGSNASTIWESFDHPADTMLPAQIIGRSGEINSKMSKTNFSTGRFQLRLLPDGNLVLNTLDRFSGSPGDAYYVSGTYDAINSTNSGYQFIFDVTGYLYILKGNGQRVDLTIRGTLPSGDYYHRATLDSDGVFTQYYYPKNPTRNTSWEEIMIVPQNICDTGKACGLNNICSLEDNRPKCECPRGFSMYDSNYPNGDCEPGFSPSCDEGYGEEQFELIELSNVNWPGSDYVDLGPINEEQCKTSCLKDCFCAVALHRNISCWKKKLPLSDGRKVPSDIIKTFFKVKKSDLPPGNSPVLSRESKRRRSLILVGTALLSTCMFVIAVLVAVICVGFFRVYKKKAITHPYRSISEAVETTLPRFKYQELVNATDGFNDELGQGAFGVVYKGVIGTKPVAVKKLHPVVQDAQKEFKTEVHTIARTHHKNLVQLLGYCDDGEQRLLIYEYMSNGTLAFYLFGDMRPSWKQRSNIAVGVARGLSYLHEECSAQIIHCDIKPQNILLDDYHNAKIADFGLAKLLKINQSRTHTGIRGTKGYVAPEWFRNTPVTVKVDVYSFGVLLLEIISCRKSVVFESDNEDIEILTDLAWDFYHEGRLDAFVKNDLEALNDYKNLETFVMVGIWCIQENPSLRPTMKKVVQMLEREVEVKEPPCPCPNLYVTSY